jgi:hypothetical protein
MAVAIGFAYLMVLLFVFSANSLKFFFIILLFVLGVHGDIYKSSYNIS